MKLILDALQVFISMAKVGLIGFGGGNAMVSLVEHEVVHVQKWMTVEQFQEAIGMSFAVPGLSAGKLAAFAGYHHAGWLGLFAGIIGVWLPGMIFMLALFFFLKTFKEASWYPPLMKGFLFASVGLIAASIFSAMPKGDLAPAGTLQLVIGLVIAAAVFAVIISKNISIPPVVAVLCAGMVGLVVLR